MASKSKGKGKARASSNKSASAARAGALRWSSPTSLPGARFGAAAVAFDTNVYLIGGSTGPGQFCADVLCYEMDKGTWAPSIQLSNDELPQRSQASVIRVGDALWLFGGKANGYRNDVYKFNGSKWSQVDCTGTKPSPRFGHSALEFNGLMWVFGGYDADATPCNDLYTLDLGTAVWTRLTPDGSAPAARYGHCACRLLRPGSGPVMIVYGGAASATALYSDVWSLNLSTPSSLKWSELYVSGSIPPPRRDHAAWVFSPSPHMMYIYGGQGEKKVLLDDLWALSLDSAASWLKMSPVGKHSHGPCAFAAAVSFGSLALILGGQNDHGDPLKAFSILELPWSPIGQLNKDVLKIIFGYLSAQQLGRLQRVCKRWNVLLRNDEFWDRFVDDRAALPRVGCTSSRSYVALMGGSFSSALIWRNPAFWGRR